MNVSPNQICRRCEAVLSGEYCSSCGQRRAEPLTIRRVSQEAVGKLLELDLAYPRTVFELIRRPAWMIREYLDGNRSTWFNPGKFLFLNATFYALIVTFIVPVERIAVAFDGSDHRNDVVFAMSVLAYAAFLYLLVAAVVARWLLKSALASVAEAYVVLLYVYGQALLVLAVLGIAYWHVGLTRLLLLFYIVWVIMQLAEAPRWKAILKGVVVYIVYTAAAMLTFGVTLYLKTTFSGSGGLG